MAGSWNWHDVRQYVKIVIQFIGEQLMSGEWLDEPLIEEGWSHFVYQIGAGRTEGEFVGNKEYF